jgi:protein SCO1/2
VVRQSAVFILITLILACARTREYELRGQIVAVDHPRQEVTIKHEDIRGFMPGMTMPFKVRDGRLIEGRTPGDLVRARLVVEEKGAYLSAVERTGHAPLTEPPPSPRVDLLEPGAEIPDADFLDQTRMARRLSAWKGQARAVTFMYTRCPLPDFCPLMDRNFAAVQREIAGDAALAGRAHLVSVSIDPSFDTPAVLAQHAQRVGANPAHWSLLTGDRGTVEQFASRFGVSIMREDGKGADIVHNLRTAVIDREGRLVKVFRGTDWTPAQIVGELKAIAVR